MQLLDELGDELRVRRIEAGRRLVEEEQLRPDRERPGDPDALLHAARELRGEEPQHLGAEADEPEVPRDALGDLALAEARVLAQRVRHVLVDRERVEERRALEDVAHPPPHRQEFLLAEPLDAPAEHPDLPGVRADQARDQAEQHRLARTAAAHHDQRLTPHERERHAAEHLARIERPPYAHELDDRIRHACPQ